MFGSVSGLYSVPFIYVSIFLPVPNSLDYCSFKEVLKSGRVILFFFLKVAFAVLGPMNVHFKIRLLNSKKKVTAGILIGVSLNL